MLPLHACHGIWTCKILASMLPLHPLHCMRASKMLTYMLPLHPFHCIQASKMLSSMLITVATIRISTMLTSLLPLHPFHCIRISSPDWLHKPPRPSEWSSRKSDSTCQACGSTPAAPTMPKQRFRCCMPTCHPATSPCSLEAASRPCANQSPPVHPARSMSPFSGERSFDRLALLLGGTPALVMQLLSQRSN